MTHRLALVTSNPRLVHPFVADQVLHRALDLEIPVAIWVHPSMRLLDRLRDLRMTVRRRARINRTTATAQLVHHFAYRPVDRASTSGDLDAAVRELSNGRTMVETRSVNDDRVADAIHAAACAFAIIVGSDVLTRSTIGRLAMPLFNVHFADPAFVRGLPPVFWEILGGRDTIHVTLHELTGELDAGAVIAQREVRIAWEPTLGATIRTTREAATREVAQLLADGLARIGAGAATPRPAAPGPLRTTPTIREILEARRICRRRFQEGRER
jgi:folate-dependent phosphoribosylglycinamide formyltransferase PurN